MEEKVLMEGIANPVAGLVIKNGHGALTTKRFIYGKHSMAKILVLGALVNLTKGSFEYDIPLDEIESAKVERFRLGHALTITKKDGTVFKYGIGKPEEWRQAFELALSGGGETAEELAPTPAKNFCQNCGAKLEAGANFCPNCGAKL